MKRNIQNILTDTKTLTKAVLLLMKEADRQVEQIALDPHFSKFAVQEERQKQTAQIRETISRQRRKLKALKQEAHDILQNDNSRLNYKSLDPGFVSFIQTADLSPNDYRLLAIENKNNPTALSLLSGSAKRAGFILEVGTPREKQIEMLDATFQRVDKDLSDALTDPTNLKDGFWEMSCDNTSKLFEPISADSIRCSATIEESIAADFAEKKISDTTECQFAEAFGAPINDNYKTALSSVESILADFNNSEKTKRVTDAIIAVNKPETLLSDSPMTADSIKLSADAIRKSGDTKTADEVKHIADLMLKGTVFVDDYGTRVKPDSTGIHDFHEKMKRESAINAQKIENQKRRTGEIAKEVEKASEYGM